MADTPVVPAPDVIFDFRDGPADVRAVETPSGDHIGALQFVTSSGTKVILLERAADAEAMIVELLRVCRGFQDVP